MGSRRAALLAAGLALAVHLPALSGGFVHDDKPQIVFNPLVRGLGTVPILWGTGVWIGAGSGSSFYRPLMTTSFALDAALLGRAPLPMHAVQLLLFAALVVVAVRLVARLEGDARVGLAAGLVLAVHPVNVEAVAWLSARCDVLAALFVLLCLTVRARRLRADAPALAVADAATLFLALASKESAVVVLPALLALERAQGAAFDLRALARRWAGSAVALASYAALRTHALGSLSGGLLGASDPIRAAGAFGQGLLRLLLPAGLSITPPSPSATDDFAGAFFLAAGTVLALRLWQWRSRALVPLVLGLSSLAVAASGAARIGELADRYLLLPSLALAWLAARGIVALAPGIRRGAWRLGLAVLVLFAVLSWRHNSMYHDDWTLWSSSWAHNPTSGRAALNAATALLEAGDAQGAGIWLERAAAIDPTDRLLRLNQAVRAAALGDAAGARRLLLALAASDPTYWPAQLRLGHLALDAGEPGEAAARYEAALRIHPLSAEAWAGLGVARARQGRTQAAREALQRALTLDPDVQNADALRAMLQVGTGGEPR